MPDALSAHVQISRRFLRSVRIDDDYGRTDALDGFVLQPSARNALETLSRHILETQQRAFTWTGPYGGGKSSLALALLSLVHPEKGVQQAARKVLNLQRQDLIQKAFDSAPGDGWTVLPIVGSRTSVVESIAEKIDELPYRRKTGIPLAKRDVISELATLSEARNRRGVLVVIDELGKFLEHSATSGDDVFFYQQLAEAASRARGKLVVIGILHQAFEQYAQRLGREARDEWAKVQGRYIDISLATGTDETLDLIGRAISDTKSQHPQTKSVSKLVAESIATRKPSAPSDLPTRLDRCWPLHPVTATLLGPGSKRKFGQNERSVFGFLNSIEPKGFRDFLEGTKYSSYNYYWPWDFWDYLRTNLEPAILASPDGHRWALGAEAVERAETKVDPLQLELVKTVALIELFRNGSGLAADEPTLQSCFPSLTSADVLSALTQLSEKSILIFRRHLNAWGVYAGSDFDIESATSKARIELGEIDIQAIAKLGTLPPVLAKRVYSQYGAMRFVTRRIISSDEAERYVQKFALEPGACAEFLLLLPGKSHSAKQVPSLAKHLSAEKENAELIVGVPLEAVRIVEAARELFALEHVFKTRTELDTDRVAAREISARIDALTAELEDLLRDSFLSARWFWHEERIEKDSSGGLSTIASNIAEKVFHQSPIFMSELINRDFPSSNSVKSRRDLMYRMLSDFSQERLGYEGYPPDAGMYASLLRATRCHQEQPSGEWAFQKPDSRQHGAALLPLWRMTDKKILRKNGSAVLKDLYSLWEDRPYGMKAGVMPIIALAYYLANRKQLALYYDGIFTPELTPVHVDEWLQDPTRVQWRFVEINATEQQLLNALSTSLSETLGRSVTADSLDSARALVALIMGLPEWTKRTSTISKNAELVRQNLLRANDPHRVLFLDLPSLLGQGDMSQVSVVLLECLQELEQAYKKMLGGIEEQLFSALDHHASLEVLRARGSTVTGISGDFRLDAFALRLSEYQGAQSDIESLIALAVSKPSKDWNDRDIQAALIQLGQWSLDFRRIETLAPMKNRPATRQSFAVIFGQSGGNRTTTASFDVGTENAATIASHLRKIKEQRPKGLRERRLFLAALVELGAELADEQNAGGSK
jgi:hypothetical protein